jgi:sugar O-acyltransferase (sialic acid O-acetyltransferase NeuD family)
MFNRLIIIGAGGHGKVVADIALNMGYTDIAFIDDKATGDCMGFPILGPCSAINTLDSESCDFIIAVGNNSVREKIASEYDVGYVSLIHPTAQIGMDVTVGVGTVVMAGAIINSCATVGNHCIINTRAVIEHDNIIRDYAHVSPGATLGGTVCVGKKTHVGIGATVKNNITICDCCTICAGAVVTRSITDPDVYVGIPAKKLIK